MTETNQSLLNQVRAKDVGTLAGLQYGTGTVNQQEQDYMSTDDRELAAWQQGLSHQHELGDVIYDETDLDSLRAGHGL